MPMPTDFPPPLTQSPFASMRAHHAGLRVADIDAAVEWYADALDFRVMHSMTLGTRRFIYVSPPARDDFWIELLGGQPTSTRPDQDEVAPAGWDHICLEVDDIDSTLAELRSRNVDVQRGPFDVEPISRRIAFFADPWGNIFELFQKI